MLPHRFKRNSLGRFRGDEKLAVVFRRKKPLRNHNELPCRDRQNGSGDGHDEDPVAERPLQRNVVALQQAIEEALERHIQAAVFRSVLRAQKAAAKHRRESQRDETRNKNGRHDHNGKFVQQASHDPAHEEHGNENGGEGERHGDDREANLSGAAERCLHDAFAHFNVTNDVFEHDYGVVDDEANGQREGEKRKIVDGVVQRIHHDERADDRHRQGNAGNECGRKIPQKEENHEYDERDRKEQREFHVAHRLTD